MSEQVVFRTVLHDGGQGDELGRLTRSPHGIEATSGVAAETLAMLQRRFRLTDEQVFTKLVERGWTNGQILAVTPDPSPSAEGSGSAS